MCGIAGALHWQDGTPPAVDVAAMVRALRHRGPDGCGLVNCEASPRGDGPRVALGHTRLAILDLSDRGAQPMRGTADLWITFNGEVYNFAGLRTELERDGVRFASGTDTEVIVRGYERWGVDIVRRLRGMFALAIWDGRASSLLMARDRFGIKPLYFYRDRGRLLFASEIRALLATGTVPRRLDLGALDTFLAYQSVPPPRTLVAGVRMVPPGTMVLIDASGREEARPYWDLLDASAAAGVDAGGDVPAQVRRRLVEATALHLISDVPVGVFLSGGIDSSALAALAREAGAAPRTFSVVLPGSSEDESQYARLVAKTFGLEHQEIVLTGEQCRQTLPEALAAVDHPTGDGLNTYSVCRAAHEAGLKVALSGLGGDEIFGGYPSFDRLRILAAISPVWRRSPHAVRAVAAEAVRSLGAGARGTAKTAALLESDGSVPQAFPVLRQLFDARTRRRMLAGPPAADGDPYVALLAAAEARHPGVDVMRLVSYAETRTYMHDVLLRDTDQMSMAHGLEVRVPLLDHVLAEFVVGLPQACKRIPGRAKPLLVDALGGMLPATAVDRPKQGFVLPFASWMRNELRPFCEHHLGEGGLARRPFVHRSAVGDVWHRFLAGDPGMSWSRPWTLVALNAWLASTGVEP